MAVIKRETVVNAPADKIWSTLINDPNHWTEWLTPVRGLEEKVNGSVREGLEFHVTLGRIGGANVKITQVEPGRVLKWNAGREWRT